MPPTRRFGARPRPAQAGGRRGTYALPERQKVATSGVAPHGAPCFAADHSGHVKTWLVYAMPPWRSIMRSGSVGRGTRPRQSRETRRRALLSRRTAFGAHGQVVQHQVFRRRGRHGAGSGAFWHQSAGPRHVRRHEGVCTLAYRVVCVAVCACQRGMSWQRVSDLVHPPFIGRLAASRLARREGALLGHEAQQSSATRTSSSGQSSSGSTSIASYALFVRQLP